MAAVFLSAAVTCFAMLFLGQAALRLAGAREWSWLAPPIGLAVAMLVATSTVHVPGRTTTMAVLLAALTIAAAVWCLRAPPHRPPLSGLLAALPVALLVATPFLAAGRGGILGVTVNNDMTVHLAFVEGYLSSAVAAAYPLPSDYPLGPHALTALLSRGLGAHPDLAFSGFTMALPVIGAWTAVAAARRAPWPAQAVVATLAGLPFLVAAYYGQGSFKEVAQAGLVLAVALSVAGYGPRLGGGRWVPLALLTAGIVSAYSPAGLVWPLAILGLWLAGQLAILLWRRRLRDLPGIVRRELPALGIGLAVLAAVLLPQVKRMWEFVALREGTGIAVDDIGNLVGRLPGWEALGVWNNPDYRLPASPEFTGGAWSLFVVALILFGSCWAFRRGRWILPLAALASLLIWRYSDRSQSPYVAAKALVIASPLLLLVAALPVADREPGRRTWSWLLVSLLAAVLVVRVGGDDLRALRWSPVGPTDHARQLETFRPLIAGDSVLFLDSDEFYIWELAGAHVQPFALGGVPVVPSRPRKDWEYPDAIDFDSVEAATLNDYEWIVTPRDRVASAPPPQLRLVRSTGDFQLWKRTGPVRERSVLSEEGWPGAVLVCASKEGREIVAAGGVAAVRPLPKVAQLESAAAGSTVTTRFHLPAGKWELSLPYNSPYPVRVSAPGLSIVLPPNLDRLGPRLSIGRLDLRRPRSTPIYFHVEDTLLAPPTAVATFSYVVAVPADGEEEIVPVGRACGRYVDWYRSGFASPY